MLGPYLGIAAVLILIWALIAFRNMETPAEQSQEEGETKSELGRLWRNRHYRYGVAAQFFNVAAQVCAWSFTIQYARDVVGVPADDAGWYLQASDPVSRLAVPHDVPAREVPAHAAADGDGRSRGGTVPDRCLLAEHGRPDRRRRDFAVVVAHVPDDTGSPCRGWVRTRSSVPPVW